jgi:hypothetical protein
MREFVRNVDRLYSVRISDCKRTAGLLLLDSPHRVSANPNCPLFSLASKISITAFPRTDSERQGVNPIGSFEGGKSVWYERRGIPKHERREKRTMAMKKIAISLPGPVLERVDRLAASRGESRSHLIATVLDRVARAKHDRDITAQIDALFTEDKIRAEQKATADEFLRMSSWPKRKW